MGLCGFSAKGSGKAGGAEGLVKELLQGGEEPQEERMWGWGLAAGKLCCSGLWGGSCAVTSKAVRCRVEEAGSYYGGCKGGMSREHSLEQCLA